MSRNYYGFKVVAITSDGNWADETMLIVNTWAQRLTARRTAEQMPVGDPFGDVWSALGWAFTQAIAEQAYAWSDGHMRQRHGKVGAQRAHPRWDADGSRGQPKRRPR